MSTEKPNPAVVSSCRADLKATVRDIQDWIGRADTLRLLRDEVASLEADEAAWEFQHARDEAEV